MVGGIGQRGWENELQRGTTTTQIYIIKSNRKTNFIAIVILNCLGQSSNFALPRVVQSMNVHQQPLIFFVSLDMLDYIISKCKAAFSVFVIQKNIESQISIKEPSFRLVKFF